MSAQVEKKLIAMAHELGELLQKKMYDEAYTAAGALNAELKKEEVQNLPFAKLDPIQKALRSYYYNNKTLNGVGKKMYMTGKSLLDLG